MSDPPHAAVHPSQVQVQLPTTFMREPVAKAAPSEYGLSTAPPSAAATPSLPVQIVVAKPPERAATPTPTSGGKRTLPMAPTRVLPPQSAMLQTQFARRDDSHAQFTDKLESQLAVISAELWGFIAEQRRVNTSMLETSRQFEARLCVVEAWKDQLSKTDLFANMTTRLPSAEWEPLTSSARAAAASAAGKELERRRMEPSSIDSSASEARTEARLATLELNAKLSRALEERLATLESQAVLATEPLVVPDVHDGAALSNGHASRGRAEDAQIAELLDFEEWLSRQVQAMQRRIDAMQDAVEEKLVTQIRRLEHQVGEQVVALDRAAGDVRENCTRMQEHEVKLTVLKTKTEAQEERLVMFERYLRSSGSSSVRKGGSELTAAEGALRLVVPTIDVTSSV